MKKIRITKHDPPEECNNISRYIGSEYEVINKFNGGVCVILDNCICAVYRDEFEWV